MISVKEIDIPFWTGGEILSLIYGYARCSTDETRQDIDRQKRELFAMGVKEEKHIYWEYESGTKENRAELLKLLDVVILLQNFVISLTSFTASIDHKSCRMFVITNNWQVN